MLNNKDYCDYDTCVALKELGFSSVNNEYFQSKIVSKETPLKFFDTTLQGTSLEYAPIISLYEAQKWLREEKHIDVLVYLDDLKGYFPFIRIWEGTWKTFINLEEMEAKNVAFSSYEEALSAGLKEAVNILKEENNENNL